MKNKFNYCRFDCECHENEELCNPCILHKCYSPFKEGKDYLLEGNSNV